YRVENSDANLLQGTRRSGDDDASGAGIGSASSRDRSCRERAARSRKKTPAADGARSGFVCHSCFSWPCQGGRSIRRFAIRPHELESVAEKMLQIRVVVSFARNGRPQAKSFPRKTSELLGSRFFSRMSLLGGQRSRREPQG